jgi:hypothetical protein
MPVATLFWADLRDDWYFKHCGEQLYQTLEGVDANVLKERLLDGKIVVSANASEMSEIFTDALGISIEIELGDRQYVPVGFR